MNAKSEEKERILLNKIASHFNQYLKQGKRFDPRSFTQHIDPNLNINRIDRLLRIHFILTKTENDTQVGVIDFVNNLPDRIRRIKTTVKLNRILIDGEVRGKIEWCKTFQVRNNQDPKNKSLFVCNQIERDYDIPENLVLKRLLQIIHDIIFNELQIETKKYDWLNEWVDEKGLKEVIKLVYLRNVYVKRVDLKDFKINERVINQSLKSRIPLYREAAVLLSRYYKLMNYDLDDTEAKSLLKNTFIQPKDPNKLFELYWIIEIIQNFKNVQLELLEEGCTCVAHWKHNNSSYEIYHNSVMDAGFNFDTEIKNPTNSLGEGDYFNREYKIIRKYEELTTKKYLGNLRPDIILKRKNSDGILDLILIGEVKYTKDIYYAHEGLQKLLTYVSLIREKSEYIDNDASIFSLAGRIRGCLFIDEVPGFSLNEDACIRYIKFDDDQEKLTKILEGL
jgi:hypothetical protein